jgi:GGDEF domain-containing protein
LRLLFVEDCDNDLQLCLHELKKAQLEFQFNVVKTLEEFAERLADDGEESRFSFSSGLAIYPNDGDAANELLEAADRALYAMKADRGGKVRKRGDLSVSRHVRP